jgi:hypothetical protein
MSALFAADCGLRYSPVVPSQLRDGAGARCGASGDGVLPAQLDQPVGAGSGGEAQNLAERLASFLAHASGAGDREQW